jgi:nucleoid DNA-binding protein
VRLPDLVNRFAAAEEISRRHADGLVRDFVAMLGDLLVEGHEIEIRGLGKFAQRKWKARKSHLNHVECELPERRVVKFLPSESLRGRIRETPVD